MARTFKDQKRYQAKQMIRTSFPYIVARMKDNGQWQPLERFVSYDDADERVDYWSDCYPGAFVDVVHVEDLNHIWAVESQRNKVVS